MCGNTAKPRAIFMLWMVCQDKLATKKIFKRFCMIHDDTCCFYEKQETLHHLMFECEYTKTIWNHVLSLLQIMRSPFGWQKEIHWILNRCKGKGLRAQLFKCVLQKSYTRSGSIKNSH